MKMLKKSNNKLKKVKKNVKKVIITKENRKSIKDDKERINLLRLVTLVPR